MVFGVTLSDDIVLITNGSPSSLVTVNDEPSDDLVISVIPPTPSAKLSFTIAANAVPAASDAAGSPVAKITTSL